MTDTRKPRAHRFFTTQVSAAGGWAVRDVKEFGWFECQDEAHAREIEQLLEAGWRLATGESNPVEPARKTTTTRSKNGTGTTVGRRGTRQIGARPSP